MGTATPVSGREDRPAYTVSLHMRKDGASPAAIEKYTLLAKDLAGLEVMFLSLCPEHKVGVIVVGPPDGMDAECIAGGIEAMTEQFMHAQFEQALRAKDQARTS